MSFTAWFIREICLLLLLLSSDSWHSISGLAQALVPSKNPLPARRICRRGASTNNEEMTVDVDQTLEPSLEVLREWTLEYLQDLEAAGGILSNPEFWAHWLADDFIQTGPEIGPLNKRDYLYSCAYFWRQGYLGEAIPDLTFTTDGWHVDPHNPWRIWVVVRFQGTATKRLGSNAEPEDPPQAFCNGPELYSYAWKPNKQIQWHSVGYIGDKYTGDNQGYGAPVGFFVSTGVSKGLIDFLSPLRSLQIWFSQFNDGIEQPRSLTPYSQLPDWWKRRKKLGWNIKQ